MIVFQEDDQNITLKDTTTKNWEITGRRARAPAFNYSGERLIRGELSSENLSLNSEAVKHCNISIYLNSI